MDENKNRRRSNFKRPQKSTNSHKRDNTRKNLENHENPKTNSNKKSQKKPSRPNQIQARNSSNKNTNAQAAFQKNEARSCQNQANQGIPVLTANNTTNAQAASNSKKSYFNPISMKKIVDLLSKTPEEIVLELCNPRFRLNEYLEAERMTDELIEKLVSLLERAFECNSLRLRLVETTRQLAVSRFFVNIMYEHLNKRTMNNTQYNLEFIESVMNLCCLMIETNPYIFKNIAPIKERIEILVTLRLNNPSTLSLYEETLSKINSNAEKRIESERNKEFRNIDLQDVEPEEDFAEMSILPQIYDILVDQTPFLRKIITSGAYKDVHHYLDVQFRLLREDYIQPLRTGIKNFRTIIKESKVNTTSVNNSNDLSKAIRQKLVKIESLNIFFDVTMESEILHNYGIVHSLKMDLKKEINWEISKKLMYGSLICLSSDFFMNECLIGVVCERDSKLLKTGIIYVKFEYDPLNQSNYNTPIKHRNYVMLEATAFFEAYRHVLEALVSFRFSPESDFPFKEHLVYGQNKQIDVPPYLKNACFDFRTIIDTHKRIMVDNNGESTYVFTTNLGAKCYLTNEYAWPSAKHMHLDESQYAAIRLALNNRITLIQGPPGTGKTYIGVKIVQLLLHNKHLWFQRPMEPKRPILMICYTNHALDQFLDYCVNECKLTSGIVRVGGRSTIRKEFQLSTLKKEMKDERRIDSRIFNRIKEQLKILRELKEKSDQLNKLIKEVESNCIVKFELIKDFIRWEHMMQFEHLNEDLNNINKRAHYDYTLLEWLGFFRVPTEFLLEKRFAEFQIDNDQLDEEDQLELEDELENTSNTEKPEEQEEKGDDLNGNQQMNEDESDDLIENDKRMLEDDFIDFVNLSKEDYFEQQKFKSKRNDHITMDQEDIFQMLFDFNLFNDENFIHIAFDFENQQVKSISSNETTNEFKAKTLSNIDVSLKTIFQLINDKDYIELIENVENLWNLNYRQRYYLYLNWLQKFIQSQREEIKHVHEEYNKNAMIMKEMRLQEDLHIMKNAQIIAMTTSGSSRYHNVLKDIGPRIVIVEEAAEVFEAHIVSSLSRHCEHLILIGDHVQLRPNPAVYKLATKYKLDVSLFERLLNNDIKKVMLNSQHRMRPEISKLMKHFYPEPIQDHESVFSFPSLVGLTTPIFFLNHNKAEKSQNQGQSKVNEFEAIYISEFCQYLLKQQYEQTQITILSMYLGQMMLLKTLLRNKLGLKGIKLSTVDNYQGEENDIVILSLVRSNKDDKIGFLSIQNRMCVALSRARRGLFVIGNFDFIGRNNEKWLNIIESVKEMNCMDSALRLSCGFHVENDIYASEPEHFRLRPNGGCSLPCTYRLECGHSCTLKCHTYDLEHNEYICKKPCDKVMRCGHQCKQLCSHAPEDEKVCMECKVAVPKLIPECGHISRVRCDLNKLTRKNCSNPCKIMLDCGHLCTKNCSAINCYPCETRKEETMPCKHKTKCLVMCADKIWTFKKQCSAPCNETLECGHTCTSKCYECFGGYIHNGCQKKCNRLLFCGHKCETWCSKQCAPCAKKCENKCSHSKCNLKCSEPCKPCMEKCNYKCEHSKCTKLCHELCDRQPCTEPCKKRLKCGHECIGFCGETCPPLCRICDKDQVTEVFFGEEDNPDARFVYMDDCKHTLEANGLEQWIQSRYTDSSNESIQWPECPKCKTQIRKCSRFAHIIRKQLNLIEEIKLKQFGNKQENVMKTKQLAKEIIEYKKMAEQRGSLSERNRLILKSILAQINQEPKKNFLSFNELVSIENTWKLFKKLNDFNLQCDQELERIENLNEASAHLKYEIEILTNLFANKKNSIRLINDKQKANEMLSEINRLEYLLDYYKLKNHAKSKTFEPKMAFQISRSLIDLENIIINNVVKFSCIKQNVAETINALKSQLNISLSEKERVMIVEAMGLRQGHWFKCPNGHIYCITECGGAVEEANCPEANCKEKIGGKNHALLGSNGLASEMDGAQISAWSNTAYQLQNWLQNNQ